MAASRVTLHLVKTETVMYSGKRTYGPAKPLSLPTYEVCLDGSKIGVVARAMCTREQRTPGKRYVNARWQSPGWIIDGVSWTERRSRSEAVKSLLEKAGLSWQEVKEQVDLAVVSK